jgi:hypothetical protein
MSDHALTKKFAEQGSNFVSIVELKRSSVAVVAVARLTFANTAADSGVLL